MVAEAAAALVAVMTMFWGVIVRTFWRWIIPALRSRLGDSVADAVADLLAWIDRPVCVVRRGIGAALGLFREKILGMTEKYQDNGAAVEKVTEILLVHETKPNTAVQVTRTEAVPYHEIPAEARREMIRNGRNDVTIDTRRGIEAKVAERAREQGIEAAELTLAEAG